MGGGDLNMKKHFHPLTMQNLERVWKAEQKAKDEAQKLEQLQRELEEERRRESLQQHAMEQGIIKKKNEKLDWMYAGPQINHEEYLLGKKIDKNTEVLKESDEKDVAASNHTMDTISDPIKDMAAKIKEDPLFLIRKKEEDSKKELVQNPIKLKKLKEMLNISVGNEHQSKKSKKRKERKSKKRHHRKHYSDSDDEYHGRDGRVTIKKPKRSHRHASESESSVEDRSRRKDKKKHRKGHHFDHENENHNGDTRQGFNKSTRSRRYSSDSEYSEEDRLRKKNKRINGERHVEDRKSRERRGTKRSSDDLTSHKDGRYGSKKKMLKHSGRDSHIEKEDAAIASYKSVATNGQPQSPSKYGLTYTKSHNGMKRHSQMEDSYKLHHSGTSREYSSSRYRKSRSSSESGSDNYSKETVQRKSEIRNRRHENSSSSESEPNHPRNERKTDNYTRKQPRNVANNLSKKLKAEELERRRQEMMDNAKWRDDQRKTNIKQYKMEDEKEEQTTQRDLKNFDRESKAKFIHEMQVKSYSTSSTASVEDRIKRNIYTKQRTQVALSKKFTEK